MWLWPSRSIKRGFTAEKLLKADEAHVYAKGEKKYSNRSICTYMRVK